LPSSAISIPNPPKLRTYKISSPIYYKQKLNKWIDQLSLLFALLVGSLGAIDTAVFGDCGSCGEFIAAMLADSQA